jgi:hypothetical protein
MGPPPATRTAGLADPVMRTFHRAAFAAALADLEAPTSLQYGLAEGSERLRRAIAERMAALSISNHTPATIAEGLRRVAAAGADVPVPTGVSAG